MNMLQVLLYRDLPKNFLSTYGEYVSKTFRLKNGWMAASLCNGTLFLFHASYPSFSIPSYKKVIEAIDGKFMIKDKKKNIVVYSAHGEQLTPFNKHSYLYPNGWFQCEMEDGTLSLYNADGVCVGSKLCYAKVYKNGMYHMSVCSKQHAQFAGIFNALGKQLLFTNAKKAYILPNGWFVMANALFDNLGNEYIISLPDRIIPNWLLCLTGYFMKPRKL